MSPLKMDRGDMRGPPRTLGAEDRILTLLTHAADGVFRAATIIPEFFGLSGTDHTES